MHIHEVRSIEIETSFEDAFSFIADRNNLPRWADAFESVDDTRARLRTPAGTADIELDVRSSRDNGTIDWYLHFPDGTTGAAFSRVTPTDGKRVVYSFVLNAPPVPLEQLEGALSRQVATLEHELARLKELIENRS